MIKETEHGEQSALMQWWEYYCQQVRIPEYLLFAIPNGGKRSPVTGSILKAEGVRRGIPDLMLAVPCDDYAGLFIEMKVKSGRVAPIQKCVLEALSEAGYSTRVCYGFEEAQYAIMGYLSRPRTKQWG